MAEELTFPLQRSPAMKLMGHLWTGSISGQILVGALLLIGVGFMGSQGFSPISIIFFLAFLMPAAVFLHVRLVRNGKRLMEGWCDMKFFPDSEVLQFKTGFPNTMDPTWQELRITENTENIVIKGGEVGGYHLRLGNPENTNQAIRLGLWIKIEDAIQGAEQLIEFLGGDIFVDVEEYEGDKYRKLPEESEFDVSKTEDPSKEDYSGQEQ